MYIHHIKCATRPLHVPFVVMLNYIPVHEMYGAHKGVYTIVGRADKIVTDSVHVVCDQPYT